MMCELRKTVRPAVPGLAQDAEERVLDERVEARRRLVEDQQVRSVLERDDQPDLLLVAARVLLEPPARIEIEPLDEIGDVGAVHPAAQVGEVLDRVGAGQPVVEVELARQVADPPVDGDRVARRLDAEHLGATGGRSDEIEQDPHHRRLAGAIGSEEPEDLALGDVEVDVDDPAMDAVGLGQALGMDDRVHGRTPVRGAGRSLAIDRVRRPGSSRRSGARPGP